eukprot:c6096_g1_i1.p1 GENE.c6096_g1_i1~~c6096_g1_i1.p1  ORF type:complete len:292 (-),score=88.38 c6096_g1_i1:134-973(-)
MSDVQELKEKGNKLFQANEIDLAIDLYTQAIELAANMPVLFTNRALCYFKKEMWQQTISDCEQALRLDHKSVKGHYFKGLALAKQQLLTEALKEMQKALDICNVHSVEAVHFVNEIRQKIKDTKQQRSTTKFEAEIENFEKMKRELDWMLVQAQEHVLASLPPSATDAEREEKVREVTTAFQQRHAKWEKFLAQCQISPKNNVPVIPEFLKCPLTSDIFADPCIAPSGVTFDRGVIEDRIRSGTDTTQGPLYPNISLRQAIDSYYEQNPWFDAPDLTLE